MSQSCANPECDKPVQKTYCSGGCSAKAKSKEIRANLIEDVAWIIGTDTPDNVATRVGYATPEYLAKAMRTYGAPELADRIMREIERYRGGSDGEA